MSEAGVVRRRRSRVEVEKLVAEFETSGLRRGAFCQQRGLSVAALDKYRRTVHQVPQPKAAPMLPVEVISCTPEQASSDADGVLVVESRSGRRIEVRRGFDAGALERLLTVLDKA
jgi:hypothetical protein